jgi:hypothetical protein
VTSDDEDLLRTTGTGFWVGSTVGLLLVVLLVGGAAAIWLAAGTGNMIVVVVVLAAVIVVAVRSAPLVTAAVGQGAIRLSPEGIVTSGPLLQQIIIWNEIAEIEVVRLRRGGRVVSLQLYDGHRRLLSAPRDLWPRRDPDFDAKIESILRWWETYRDRPAGIEPLAP